MPPPGMSPIVIDSREDKNARRVASRKDRNPAWFYLSFNWVFFLSPMNRVRSFIALSKRRLSFEYSL